MNGNTTTRPEVLVLGGGVIGLSVARELSGQGLSVTVVDNRRVSRQASWAGAGILPPSCVAFAKHPVEKIAAESFRMHAEMATSLREETGIDNGFRRCGAIFIARTAGEQAALAGQCREWEESGMDVRRLSPEKLLQHMPALGSAAGQTLNAALVPDESQIRNPDHLRALAASCAKRGVTIVENAGSLRFDGAAPRITSVVTENMGSFFPQHVCVCAGAWSEEILAQMNCRISTLPIRGQMLLYKLPEQVFSQILYEGTRYIVPRDDGHVLVGSTLEQAGFEATTTPQALANLESFAQSLFSDLTPDCRVDAWAGLRPATWDGFPYMGNVPEYENVWAACGHFRSGLLLSPAAALVIRQLILEQPVLFDLSPFRLDRG